MNVWLTVITLGIVVCLGFEAHRWLTRRRRVDDKTSSDPGVSELGLSVEVDCRACGKFNRVPSQRLRDRPKCGRCKERLMPGKRVVLCRVTQMEGKLQAELYAAWKDDDRLWQCLADHVAIQSKTGTEARGEQPRVVN